MFNGDEKAKKFLLIFPERRGFHEGWVVLAEKLCSLGVIHLVEIRAMVSFARRKMLGYIGYISSIYRVSGGVDTIFRGEKSKGRYFHKYRQNSGDISAQGDILEIF